MLLFHAVGMRKLGDEMYKSVSQLQINAVSVVRLIAQGWRQPTPGLCMLCGSQRRRCCTFSAWNAVIKYRGIKGTTPTALFPLTANNPG